MREGPDFSRIAALLGDPARAAMLNMLMDGRAFTPSELSEAAGVTPATTSSHLARLREGGLITVRVQGRHRYVSLASPEVGAALESLAGLAARLDGPKVRTGPRDPDLRRARVCYDHLAGELAVQAFDSLARRRFIAGPGDQIMLTQAGEAFFAGLKIDMAPLRAARRPLCRACLDWSERRSHLAGSLGAALLDRVQALNWAQREKTTRIMRFTPAGARAFVKAFPER